MNSMTSKDVHMRLNHFTLQLSDLLIFSVNDFIGVSHDSVDHFKLLEDVIIDVLRKHQKLPITCSHKQYSTKETRLLAPDEGS